MQIQREEKADKQINTRTVSQNDGANARPVDADGANKQSRSRSRRRRVTDAGQTEYVGKPEVDEDTPATELGRRRNEQALNIQPNGNLTDPTRLSPPIVLSSPPDENSENPKEIPLPASPGERPSAGPGKAFPFKLGRHPDAPGDEGANASAVTLTNQAGVVSPMEDENDEQPGASLDYQDEHSIDSIDAQGSIDGQRTIEPIEDAHGEHADGVDHYDLRNKLPLDGENGNELARNAVGPIEERRGTLEDARGVLHHGPGIIGGLGKKKKVEDGGVVARPVIDRSDTASLD